MDFELSREESLWAKLKRSFNPVIPAFITTVILFMIVGGRKNLEAYSFDGGSVQTQAICTGISAWETEGAFQCEVSSQRLFDVVLVSSGGVGSSVMFAAVAKEVSIKLNSGVDRDGLKHRLFHITSSKLHALVQSNRTLSCGTRIFVFTFADAAASVFSLYRRNFHLAHNEKLHDKPFPPSCFPGNISRYADEGIDYFGLESHFHSWMHGGLCSQKVPVFFLRSEGRSIPRVWEVLRAAAIDPVQVFKVFEPTQIAFNTSASHYGADERTATDYAKLQVVYERFQGQLDALGYLSMAFRNEFKRLV